MLIYNKMFSLNEQKCMFERYRLTKKNNNIFEYLFCLPFQSFPPLAYVSITQGILKGEVSLYC
jgi:hypothetical protein